MEVRPRIPTVAGHFAVNYCAAMLLCSACGFKVQGKIMLSIIFCTCRQRTRAALPVVRTRATRSLQRVRLQHRSLLKWGQGLSTNSRQYTTQHFTSKISSMDVAFSETSTRFIVCCRRVRRDQPGRELRRRPGPEVPAHGGCQQQQVKGRLLPPWQMPVLRVVA